MTWTNSDKLVVKFGTEEAKLSNVSADTADNSYRVIEVIVDWRDLPAVADNGVLVDTAFTLDKGAFIEGVSIKTVTAFDSTSDDMTFSLGLIDTDGSSNAVKAALVDAATQTELNTLADGVENYSGWVGSAVGTTLTKKQKLVWEVDNHAAVAGYAVVRIKWSAQSPQTDTLVYVKS